MPESKVRVMYVAGPGDVVQTFRYWCKGEDDPHQIAMTYSSQFFDICKKHNAAGLIISTYPEIKKARFGNLQVENKPNSFNNKSGITYHLGQIWFGLYLLGRACFFRANMVIIAEGTHWFMMHLFNLLGIKVIPTLHCMLWPKYGPVKKVHRILLWLSRRLFRQSSFAILSISNDVTRQIKQLVGNSHCPVINFLPTYRKNVFGECSSKTSDHSRRILFAGRIEENKGVFLLLEIAKRFKKSGINVHFDICGDGSALKALREAANDNKLNDTFICHGYCNRQVMQRMFLDADLVVVPTMTDFNEGFNKVIVEAVLADRPVVTSKVCPAQEYVQDALVLAVPNNVDSYEQALLEVLFNEEMTQRMSKAAHRYKTLFTDLNNSWGNGVSLIITAARKGERLQQSY